MEWTPNKSTYKDTPHLFIRDSGDKSEVLGASEERGAKEQTKTKQTNVTQ